MAKKYSFLLIGKTGHGKSATANSIVLKKNVFKESTNMEAETGKIQYDISSTDLGIIKVVDTPGVGDNRMSEEESLAKLQTFFAQAMVITPKGYNAILIFLTFGHRFTDEEVQTIDILKQMFGHDFVRMCGIFVLTHGGELDDSILFSDWCGDQKGHFLNVYEECCKRAVLFNNKLPKDSDKHLQQVKTLLDIVDSMGGARYTNENYAAAEQLRSELMLTTKEPIIREEIEMKATCLIQEIGKVNQITDIPKRLEELKKLLTQAKELRKEVEKDDKGSGILKCAFDAVDNTILRIENSMEYCELYMRNQKEAEKQRQSFEAREEELEEKSQEKIKQLKSSITIAAVAVGVTAAAVAILVPIGIAVAASGTATAIGGAIARKAGHALVSVVSKGILQLIEKHTNLNQRTETEKLT